jgi:hypothetical protein
MSKTIRFTIISVLTLICGTLSAKSTFFGATGIAYEKLPSEIAEIAKTPDWKRNAAQKKTMKAFDKKVVKKAKSMAISATEKMMAKFKAVGKTPKAVIFIERIPLLTKNSGKRIGDTVKETAGGVPTYGTGGAGVYGITFGDEIENSSPTLMVIGLTGKDLDVKAYTDLGRVNYIYTNSSTRKKAKAGDAKAKASLEKETQLRKECKTRGMKLGKQISALKNGFVIYIGAIHNDWHKTYAEGMKETMPKGTLMIGGVGKWDDYVYDNGKCGIGIMTITVQGSDFDFATFGSSAGKAKYNIPGVKGHTKTVSDKVIAGLNGQKPDVVIGFSCVTRLRDSKVMHPKIFNADMKKNLGENVVLFGNYCGGEIYLDKDGNLDAGGDRLTIVGIKGK